MLDRRGESVHNTSFSVQHQSLSRASVKYAGLQEQPNSLLPSRLSGKLVLRGRMFASFTHLRMVSTPLSNAFSSMTWRPGGGTRQNG